VSATGGEKVEPGDLLTNQAQKWNHSKEHPQNGGLEPLSRFGASKSTPTTTMA